MISKIKQAPTRDACVSDLITTISVVMRSALAGLDTGFASFTPIFAHFEPHGI
jgi:hypothetical protein